MSNLKPPALPVGDKPSWELRNASRDDEPLKSIPESFVLLKSLKQSRDRWLHQTFPKFSTKPKGGKAADVPPAPPHSFQIRGRCDMHIGPHIFPETTIYEVSYASSQPGPTMGPTLTPTPSTNPYWSSTMAYNAQYQQQQPANKPVAPKSTNTTTLSTAPAPAPVAGPSTSTSAFAVPSTSPAPPVPPITHVGLDLIGKVNQAAENDPLLSKLLKLAAGGHATPDQLKTLGLLIQSLDNITFPGPAATAAPQNPAPPPAPAKPTNDYYQRYPPPVPVVPAKPFDVVLEFRESNGDRWLFPRGSVYWETIPNTADPRLNPDITLTTCLSNDGRISECLAEATGEGSAESHARYPVTIRFKEAPLTFSDTIYRWIGGTDTNARNKQQIEDIACNPSYALKPLRQGPAPPPRAPRPRKPPAEPKKPNRAVEDRNPPAPPQPPPAKRPRPAPPKAATPLPIRCSSCGQTDVPLIMGGKYCKPCVEAGKHMPLATPSITWASPQPFIFTAPTAPILPRTTSAAVEEHSSVTPSAPSTS
ncbi:hypothetical protein D9619_002947 [Psilocybe cf. subviscida]|uniref:Uncharacterized protein n=1 Tax=Psilocybe cf. subviscida TaxID=2480587 RepID=A0A8H5AXP5_9AGAR|nr:hypothetical protein D9619_002947 [Psilocybe cf. subviscida]